VKILLDENLPHELRKRLPGHDAYTVQYMRWGGVKNGRLLAQAATAGFDVLVTTDKSIPHQQNIRQLPLAIVVIDAMSNDFDDLLVFLPALITALNHLKPNSVTYVP
jgi:hypothetical protein